MVACNDTAADSGRAVVHHAAATAVAAAVLNRTAADGQRTAFVIKNATAVLTQAAVDDTARHGHCGRGVPHSNRRIEDTTTPVAGRAIGNGTALEGQCAVVGDAAAIGGSAASQLTTVIATAVLDSQCTAFFHADDAAHIIIGTQAAAQRMAVQVEGHGNSVSDAQWTA